MVLSENKYLFNGKELQDELLGSVNLDWYDFNFRYYDPALARFPSLDPKADKFESLSPYNYASNNPVTCIDLWGLQGVKAEAIRDEEGNLTGYTAAQSSTHIPQEKPVEISEVPDSFEPDNTTLSQGKSMYEQTWESSGPPMINEWIKRDPVVKATAVGGAVMVGSAAVAETAPSIIAGAKAVAAEATATVETAVVAYGTNQATQAAVGAATGVTEVLLEAPPTDMPPLPSFTSEFTRQLIVTSVAVTREFLQLDEE